MTRSSRFTIAALVAGPLVAGRGRIGRLLHHELEVFFAGGTFEGTHFEREPVETRVLGLFFVRIRLVRPTED